MPSTLIFPAGIRLARKDEIPGPEPRHSNEWARIESANIAPGFVLKATDDQRFTHYAEINVDAPHIWAVFRDLCENLLSPTATLIIGDIDGEPVTVGSGFVCAILAALEPHRYQLTHDGYLQCGLVSDLGSTLNEVFVAPVKYFQVWMDDEARFKAIMQRHELKEADHLEFIDEYARVTVHLSSNTVMFESLSDLARHLKKKIAAQTDADESRC